MFCPALLAVDVPMRSGAEVHAHCCPASWRVRHPCGSPVGAGVMFGVGVVLGVVGAGVVDGACVVGGVVGAGGVIGCVVGGGGDVTGGVSGAVGWVVRAKVIGAATRKAIAARASTRFMEVPPGRTCPRPVRERRRNAYGFASVFLQFSKLGTRKRFHVSAALCLNIS